MDQELSLKVIARIHTDFPQKFGVPRQSGLVESLRATIIFEPEYRTADAVRGLEQFSHIWLLWGFSEVRREGWSPTVRPPRLGGNQRMGVFATRSPFRPNPIGLSCVRLEEIRKGKNGVELSVLGADLMDGTPIYDIKPYLPYADSKPEAEGGFAEEKKEYRLAVDFPQRLLELLPEDKRQGLWELLAQDPRPAYQKDPERVYGMEFSGFEIKFSVREGLLTVLQAKKLI